MAVCFIYKRAYLSSGDFSFYSQNIQGRKQLRYLVCIHCSLQVYYSLAKSVLLTSKHQDNREAFMKLWPFISHLIKP